VTQRLCDAYRRFVDHDFVGQYLKHYVDGMDARHSRLRPACAPRAMSYTGSI